MIDLALIGARRQGIQNDSQSKKVVHLLERMELSAGFSKIEKLIQPSLIKPTLLVNEELYLSVEYALFRPPANPENRTTTRFPGSLNTEHRKTTHRTSSNTTRFKAWGSSNPPRTQAD